MINLLALALALLASFIGAFGSLYMKKGAKDFHINLFTQLKNYPLILGIGLFLISSVAYMAALRLDNLSVIYPMSSITYIWVSILSMVFLKEKMNRDKWLGTALIILGVFLIAYF